MILSNKAPAKIKAGKSASSPKKRGSPAGVKKKLRRRYYIYCGGGGGRAISRCLVSAHVLVFNYYKDGNGYSYVPAGQHEPVITRRLH